jgi:hypothetical protein
MKTDDIKKIRMLLRDNRKLLSAVRRYHKLQKNSKFLAEPFLIPKPPIKPLYSKEQIESLLTSLCRKKPTKHNKLLIKIAVSELNSVNDYGDTLDAWRTDVLRMIDTQSRNILIIHGCK